MRGMEASAGLQAVVLGSIVQIMAGFSTRLPIRMRQIVIVLVALAALVCLGGLVGSAMAMADGQGCAGPGCDHQIASSRLLQFQTPSRSAVDLLAIPAAVAADLSLSQDEPPASRPPDIRLVWPSLAPFAPRSPPAV